MGAEALAMAEEAGHPFSLVIASFGVGLLHLRQGELGRAIAVLERGLGVCQAWEFRTTGFWGVASFLGAAYTLERRQAEALPLLEQVVEQTGPRGNIHNHVLGVILLGEAYLADGRTHEALALAARGLTLAREHQYRGAEAWLLRLLGDIATQREPLDAKNAEQHYHQALTLATELGMRPLVAHGHLGLGTLYRRLGQLERAQEHLGTAVAMYRKMEMGFWGEKADTELQQGR